MRKKLSVQVKHVDILIRYARNVFLSLLALYEKRAKYANMKRQINTKYAISSLALYEKISFLH